MLFSASTCGPETDPRCAHSVNTRQDIMLTNLRGAVLLFPPPEDSAIIRELSVGTTWNRYCPSILGISSSRRFTRFSKFYSRSLLVRVKLYPHNNNSFSLICRAVSFPAKELLSTSY